MRGWMEVDVQELVGRGGEEDGKSVILINDVDYFVT